MDFATIICGLLGAIAWWIKTDQNNQEAAILGLTIGVIGLYLSDISGLALFLVIAGYIALALAVLNGYFEKFWPTAYWTLLALFAIGLTYLR